MSIIDKLNYLINAKKAIKNAIIDKGVDVSDNDTLKDYADKIDDIVTVNDTNTTGHIGVDAIYAYEGYPIVYKTNRPDSPIMVSSKDFHPGNKDWEIHIRFKLVGSTARARTLFGGYNHDRHAPLIRILDTENTLAAELSKDGVAFYSNGVIYMSSVKLDVWSEVTLQHIKEEGIIKLSLMDETLTEPIESSISDEGFFDQTHESIVSFGISANNISSYFLYNEGTAMDLSQTWIKIDGKYFLKA